MKIKNTIKKALAVLFIAVLSVNCKKIKEDNSNCGIILRFAFTKNTDNVDHFSSEVYNYTLFVFDETGKLVATYEDIGPFEPDYFKRLTNLPAGTYTFVVWGNLSDNIALNTTGAGRKDDRGIKLKTTGADIASQPGVLFYGKLDNVTVNNSYNQVVTIDLMKDTKAVQAIFHNLPLTPGQEGEYVCKIVAANGEYTFDNMPPALAAMLTYMPQNTFDVAGSKMTSNFVTLRLFDESWFKAEIILTFVPSDGSAPVEVMRVSLIDAIKAEYKDRAVDFKEFFIIQDVIVLNFYVDFTNGNFTVTVNGWKIGTSNMPTYIG